LKVYCPTSSFQGPAGRRPLRCPITAEPLEYGDLPAFDPDLIDPVQPGHWRYRAMLPVVKPGSRLITLGEGWTPLVEDEWAGLQMHWKVEAFMPTGSYKDRGVSVMVNWLAGLDVQLVVDDSSGNAGASLACYAARAGLDACIYVPSTAPAPKRAQIAIYGADLVEVPGSRELASKAAGAATLHNKDTAYASHAWHPAFLLGQMTCAWEIWEQLDRRVPDWIVAPAGNGGALLGVWRGFQHLQRSGLIDTLPRIVAVQVVPYTPIFDAFNEHWDRVRPRSTRESTIAGGIAISHPVRGSALLAAVYRSQGTVLSVEPQAILSAQEKLAIRGLFVEPTSATVGAAIEQLRPVTQEGDIIVSLLTGHGLKDPPQLP